MIFSPVKPLLFSRPRITPTSDAVIIATRFRNHAPDNCFGHFSSGDCRISITFSLPSSSSNPISLESLFVACPLLSFSLSYRTRISAFSFAFPHRVGADTSSVSCPSFPRRSNRSVTGRRRLFVLDRASRFFALLDRDGCAPTTPVPRASGGIFFAQPFCAF